MFKLKITRKNAPSNVFYFETLQEVAAYFYNVFAVDSLGELLKIQKTQQMRIFLSYKKN